MSYRADLFVWLVLPYVSITIFAVGHWWRDRRDQFGWTSRSTQLLERVDAWLETTTANPAAVRFVKEGRADVARYLTAQATDAHAH